MFPLLQFIERIYSGYRITTEQNINRHVDSLPHQHKKEENQKFLLYVNYATFNVLSFVSEIITSSLEKVFSTRQHRKRYCSCAKTFPSNK